MAKKELAAHSLLRSLGINGSYLGFYYTAAAIDIMMESSKEIRQCKWLYHEIARLYHTTPFCVERNIRTMVSMIWECGNDEFLIKTLKLSFDEKPNNTSFINGLVHYLSDGACHGILIDTES